MRRYLPRSSQRSKNRPFSRSNERDMGSKWRRKTKASGLTLSDHTDRLDVHGFCTSTGLVRDARVSSPRLTMSHNDDFLKKRRDDIPLGFEIISNP